MPNLYRYKCSYCGVPTYVEWVAQTSSTMPCCADCGETKYMEFVDVVEVGENKTVVIDDVNEGIWGCRHCGDIYNGSFSNDKCPHCGLLQSKSYEEQASKTS